MKSKIILSILLLGVFMASIFITSCQNSNIKTEKFDGIDTTNMDKSVKPQDDFYTYAVGNWVKNNPVPADQTSWGAFMELYENTNKQVKEIIKNVSKVKSAKKGSVEQLVRDFYKTGMDSVKIEKLGMNPIKMEFEKIQNIKTRKGLLKVLAHMHLTSSAPMFSFGSETDQKNSRFVIAGLSQGGIGLPDRDYYTNKDKRSEQVREKYAEHMQKIFVLSGDSEELAKKEAASVMKIETQLAEHSRTRVERRDPNKNYNAFTFAKLQKLTPNFDWNTFFVSQGITPPKKTDVGQPDFFKNLNKMITTVKLSDWKTYLKWNLLRRAAPYANSAFVEESFNFRSKFMRGAKKMRPRWKRVLSATNGSLGEALGQLYVKQYFPEDAKTKAKAIVKNVLTSMGESIKNNSWMSDKTKKLALVKLDSFHVKIGYPDKWKDYSGLEIGTDSYLQNIMRATEFATKKDLAKIGKAADKAEWGMSPQTVNAYYNPVNNEVVFPAAILQYPFYDVRSDDAVNYGGMGAVIGHEITHGFDDQGRQYDADGNIRDWWTKEDAKKYNARAQKIINQFNNYEPIDSLHINGELTQGENIADLGGLTISFAAFKKTKQYKENKKIDGFTPAQRLYLSWANVWKGNIRDKALKVRLKTDPHSPGKYRVLGPLSNLTGFYKAFDVKNGDAMRQPKNKRVKIW